MEESEFKERFPMIAALQKSTELFNKKKYDDAIKSLENALNKDPSTDFTSTIRGDVWFNLSVLYVLKGQSKKVFEALIEYMKFTNIRSYYQVISQDQQLTESQAKALKRNYKFNSYSYFLKSSKHKKAFNFFLKELETMLTETEFLVRKEEYLDANTQLNFFKDIIIYSNFSTVDIFKRQLTFENKDLYNIFSKVDKLVDLCESKQKEIIVKSLEEEFLSIEKLIDENKHSEAIKKLNDFLKQYKINGISLTQKKAKETILYQSDEIYRRAKDLIELAKDKQKAETPEAKALREILVRSLEISSSVYSLAISPNGKYLVSGSEEILILDLETFNLIKSLKKRKRAEYVHSVAISSDGKYIISGDRDHNLTVFNFTSGEIIWSIEENIEDVHSVAVSPDNKYIVCGLGRGTIGGPPWDSNIKVFEFSSGKLIHTLIGHKEPVGAIIISSDSQFIISGAIDIKIWDLSSGELVKNLDVNSRINSLIISPDGNNLLSASSIKIWEMSTWTKSREISVGSGKIEALAVSPDCKYIVGGSIWASILIYEYTSGKLIKEFRAHETTVRSIIFSNDGKYLISGAGDNPRDGSIKIWNFPNILNQIERELEPEEREEEIEIKANSLLKELDMSKTKKDDSIEFESVFKQLQEQTTKLNFVDAFIHKNSINSLDELFEFFRKRENLLNELNSTYRKFKKNERIRNRIKSLFIRFYTLHFEINPFEADENLLPYLKSSLEKEITRLKNIFNNIAREDTEFNKFKNELESINYDQLKNAFFSRLGKKVKEITFNIPASNLFEFLLDFSEVIPDPNISKLGDSTEDEYSLKASSGILNFKITEREIGKKIIYDYDFTKSIIQEKGQLTLIFDEITPGKVRLKLENLIYESTNASYYNWIGKYLKQWIDFNLGKIVAKQMQAILYEKDFDDLTIGNYKILQAKISAMGKNIDKLNTKYFEVKAPLTLTSFNCSECGATLNIISKKEKFIICGHCDTPFLMEWQRY